MSNKVIFDWIKKIDVHLSRMLYGSFSKTKRNKSYLKTLEYSCHGIPWFAITIISLYLFPGKQIIGHLLVGLILDIIYVAIIKALTQRKRPYYARQDDQFCQFGVDRHSFPSGHASRAIYVALFFNNFTLWSFIIWIWAISVCFSRILLGRHHIGDVIGGVILGYLNFIIQFSILAPINSLLMMCFSTLFGVTFSNRNDNDIEID